MKRKEVTTVDLFCGAGGATTGLELALSRLGMTHRGLAIDHWEIAVDTMRKNHPLVDTKRMSIEEAVPADLVPGGVVDLLWASPSCTHHSRAKGGKPRDNQLRAQPELVLAWLDQLFVRRVIVENVPEFVGWGPLNAKKEPIKKQRGECFKAWVAALKARNYIVEWQIVNCADYGDATSRRRFFLKAVRKGCGRIRWPEPTHAENPQPDLFGNMPQKWRGVCECLDLSDIGRSIFNRKKPLVQNTLRRIMVGLRKYNGLDFQMDMLGSDKGDGSRVRPLSAPLPPQHAGGNRSAVVRPFVVKLRGGQFSMITPYLITEQANNAPRGIDKPLRAQTTVRKDYLCTPLVLGRDACAQCRPADKPMPTLTTGGAMRGIFPVLEDGRIIDIRIRMLKPSELAAAHSFPPDYVLTGNRGEQVKQIGNSVPVQTAAAMCAADLLDINKEIKK